MGLRLGGGFIICAIKSMLRSYGTLIPYNNIILLPMECSWRNMFYSVDQAKCFS
jgi:hypothetical protein